MSDEEPADDRRSDSSGPDVSAPSGSATGDDADAINEGQARQEASTVNHIYSMYADSAAFGTSVRKPPSIGAIKIDFIADALRVFCPADAFQSAEEALAKHGMVLLLGNEGTGRYLAALALLSGWPKMTLSKSVVSFSPITSIAELARKETLQPGRHYFVHDMRGDGRASADLRFELTRLRQALGRTGARLIVTADASALFRGDFGELAIPWTAPEGGSVFDRHLGCSGLALESADQDRARAHAVGLKRPSEVAAFVARLTEGVDAAMHSQSDADREQVRMWFDNKERTLSQELTVAAAGFLDRVPERIFERCLARLELLVRQHDADDHAPTEMPVQLYEARSVWAGSDGLITTIADDGPYGERLVAFRSQYMRRHVLDELWNRYGYGLIQPLRAWINELVRDESLVVRVQAAMGLALLAEHRWPEVNESFLDSWSNDLARHRAGAATTLSMMTTSETLAPRVLETAIAWSENSGARRAMTAALAFAGPLSQRYQDTAFERLWYLTTRGNQIAVVARVAMSLMLSGTGENHDRAMTILRLTGDAMRWTAKRDSALERRGATSTALSVLLAPSLSSDELVVAQLLRARPETVELIGPLLADVLASAPQYHPGVALLRRLLTEITSTDNAEDLARRLGSAVFAGWPDRTRNTLIPKIESDLARSEDDIELSRQVVSSFIHSIDAN